MGDTLPRGTSRPLEKSRAGLGFLCLFATVEICPVLFGCKLPVAGKVSRMTKQALFERSTHFLDSHANPGVADSPYVLALPILAFD